MSDERPDEPDLEQPGPDEATSVPNSEPEASTVLSPVDAQITPVHGRVERLGESGRRGAAGPSDDLSVAPEDLSQEWWLQGCDTTEFSGLQCPTLGRTVLLSKIGAGGMGAVYFGLNPRLSAEVAVKILDRALLERNPDSEGRFLREARIAASLDSPHLVRVLDVDRDARSMLHYIVMEYVHGPTARAWARESVVTVAEADALAVVLAAVTGLAAIHVAGAIHRDIKPENILIPLGPDGVPQLADAKVADLGLARLIEPGHSLTGTQSGLGTPGFMAPEQARDARRAGKAADVFSVGATLYALLTGTAPFRGATQIETMLATIRGEYAPIRNVRGDVSLATAAVIERCLKVDPAERFPDASALREALTLAISATDLQTPDVGPTIRRVNELVQASEQGSPWRESDASETTSEVARDRRPLLRVAVGVAVLLLAGWGMRELIRTDAHGLPQDTAPVRPERPAAAPIESPAELVVRGGVPGMRVFFDGPDVRELSWDDGAANTLSLRAGSYHVRATAPLFTDHEETIDLPPGDALDIEIPFERSAGRIDCGDAPGGVAFAIDGDRVSGRVFASAGSYQVVASREGYWPQTLDVIVTPGAPTRPLISQLWEPQSDPGTLLLNWTGSIAIAGASLALQGLESVPVEPWATIATHDGSATILVAAKGTPARDEVKLRPGTEIAKRRPFMESDVVDLRLESGAIDAVLGRWTRVVADAITLRAAGRAQVHYAAELRDAEGETKEVDVAVSEGSVMASGALADLLIPSGGRVVFTYDRGENILHFHTKRSSRAIVFMTRRGIRIDVPPDALGSVGLAGTATRVTHLMGSMASKALSVTMPGQRNAAVGVQVGVGHFVDVADGSPAVALPVSAIEDMLASPRTGASVRIRYVPSRARLAEVRGEIVEMAHSELQFIDAATGEGVEPSLRAEGLFLPTGRYVVKLLSNETLLTTPFELPEEGIELLFPSAIPKGMVFVTKHDGAPGFLIDRDEVSNARYAEFARKAGVHFQRGKPNLAAVGISLADARRFAAWSGKKLPTAEQWRTAAFGDASAASPRYPWGDREGVVGVDFFGGQDEPGPVDGCPAGASRSSGARNMAGNAIEWLSDGWLIGGNHVYDVFGDDVDYGQATDGVMRSWRVDLLRDPVPTTRVYEEFSFDQQNKYKFYQISDTDDLAAIGVGLRCVIPLE